MRRSRRLLMTAALIAGLLPGTGLAQKKYDTGASDTTIRIGNTAPYSGPVSAYSAAAQAMAAYFRKVNDDGGINGRKIDFVSIDDAYAPPKTVEAIRRLVEHEQVLLIFGMSGTATATAVHKYLNVKQVPQLFIQSGASKWGDPQHFPWTMGWYPDYASEAMIYAKYIQQQVAEPRVAILFQNDDFGKDYRDALRRGFGPAAAKAIVAEVGYEPSAPTVDSEVAQLKASGANVLVIAAVGRAATQAVRRSAELGWQGMRILISPAINVDIVLKPAGMEASKGLISTTFRKDAYQDQWSDDPGVKEWRAWMARYNPGVSLANEFYITGYSMAQTMADVLRRAGDDLTRANVMRQAASINGLALPLLLPGITLNTSASDFYPIQTFRLARFDGERWAVFGDPVGVDVK